MLDSNAFPNLAVLYCLEEALAEPLSRALAEVACQTTSGSAPHTAQIVFCPPDPSLLQEAMARFVHLPVVVVSRLPEMEGWLDALEAGAADYCAAPFEPIQLRWLLDTHARPRQARAAA